MSFNYLGQANGKYAPFGLRMAWCFVLFSGIFLTLPAHAQNKILSPVILTDATDSVSLGRHILIQKDPQGLVTLESIRKSRAGVLSGKMNTTNNVHLGYDGENQWLIFKVSGQANKTEWILDLGSRSEGRIGYLKSLRLYDLVSTAEGFTVQEIKSSTDGVYNISVKKGELRLLGMQIQAAAGRPSILPLKVFSEKSYIARVQDRAVYNTFYTLILLGFTLFFLAYTAAYANNKNLLYAGYFALTAMGWFSYMAIASVGSIIAYFLFPGLALLYCASSIVITRTYWNVEASNFTERYILNTLLWINIAVALFAFTYPTGDGAVHTAVYFGAPILTLFIVALMSLAKIRNDAQSSPLFFASWVFPFIGLIVTAAGCMQLLPQSTLILNCFWFMFIPQGILLAISIHRRNVYSRPSEFTVRTPDILDASGLRQVKDLGENANLLKVIETERAMISEFRAKEEQRVAEMRSAKEDADEANRAKSAFLAVVSHEIRTPMTGVMGMVRLLLDSSITKQQRDYVLTIQESSEAMLALLNDILDFEKIQRGKIELENISFDLHRLIQGVVTLMSGHAAEKNIGLSARIQDDLPRFVKGDPTRLRQIMLNLMGNGIKFTTTGSVTLIVKNMNIGNLQEEHENFNKPAPRNHQIYFAIQDTGIGIPAEAQKNLFNPFSQADSSIARKFGGSGLGLAISKGLVERMGGTVNINSKDGEGSTFFFTLEMPRGIPASSEAIPKPLQPSDANTPVKPLNILVVDDNAITRKVIVSFLEQVGHQITVSTTSEEALEKIGEQSFDVVLMDIELPGMPGNEATKVLRKNPDPVKSHLPVIALTGNVDPQNIEQYLSDGMSGFLAKPIDPDKLKALISDVVRKTAEHEIKMPTEQPPATIDTKQQTLQNTASTTADSINVFNPEMLQSLKDTIGGTQLSELLVDLLTKTEEILVDMQEASRAGDLKALAARAHELKGMAGNFGLTEISAIAAQTEQRVKTEELDELHVLVSSLPQASLRAQSALKEWVSH